MIGVPGIVNRLGSVLQMANISIVLIIISSEILPSPNFKVLSGSNNITVGVTDYPATDEVASTYSPFTVLPTTTHIDTRARGRYANLKI